MTFERGRPDSGSSLLELLLSISLLLVIAGAAVSLYMSNLRRYSSEQQTAEMNQTARNVLELMSLEIQQAGSHPDVSTTSSSVVVGSRNVQTVSIGSTTNLNVGDWATIDPGTSLEETFKLTAVGDSTISGKIIRNHAANAPIRLFAQPYLSGIIVPAGLGPNSSTTTSNIKFYGDINSDDTLNFVEYSLNANTGEILRSITPLTSSSKAPATAIAENVSGFSFRLYTDSWGVITKVQIRLTVNSTDRSLANQVTMSNMVTVRSVAAASAIAVRVQQYVMPNYLPPMPPKVVSW